MTGLRSLMSRYGVSVVVAVVCGLLVASAQPIGIKVIGVIGLLVFAIGWATVRDLRVHARIGRLSAEGRPAALLAVVDATLPRASRRMRPALHIYRAGALWMQGDNDAALDALDEVDLSSLSSDAARTWQFLYYSMLMTCQLFDGRIEEARGVLADHIEPFANAVPTDGTAVIARESQAKLAFFEDRHDDAAKLFESLADDDRITPAARALYHYFLGRIAHARGDDGAATEQFERAVALAPEPFWSAEVAEPGDAPGGSS